MNRYQPDYSPRRYIIIALFIVTAIVFLVRLFYLQVLTDKYILSAENNVLRHEIQYPARGLIYDRNGQLMVYNQAAYDLMVIPRQTRAIDTLEFCETLNITKEYFLESMAAARKYSSRVASVFIKQISAEEYALFQEKMYRYPGFYVQPRTIRKYSKPIAAHLLGYISEVNESQMAADNYYRLGDYIGTQGIEQSYEKILRGKKGVKISVVDVFNSVQGSYNNGIHDSLAIQGTDVISSIDFSLQEYGEKLMQNKTGSIVAIEPATGEILTLVSAPSYDPALLIGRERTKNYSLLLNDSISRPLFNRATMASYPPGSTFKPVVGLIALQENVMNATTMLSCNSGYLFMGCHSHTSPLDMHDAIATSCNGYFAQAFRMILENKAYSSTTEAYIKWREYLTSFGFGEKLGSDLVNELSGNIPLPSYYDYYYGENRWRPTMILSLGIGQGEIGATPLQMANMTAAIANRGHYYTPHIVKAFGNGEPIDSAYTTPHWININRSHFEDIIIGMEEAVNGGARTNATATIANINGIVVCGKTGTAQNPHGDDHAVFVAFAPKDNPQIAIAVYVENAGYGASYAAPIARLMIEKYLMGEVTYTALEEQVLSINTIEKLINRR